MKTLLVACCLLCAAPLFAETKPKPKFLPLAIQGEKDFERYPRAYTCDGEGGSPPLYWGKKVPKGIKSYVVILERLPEPGAGEAKTLWFIYGMKDLPGMVPDIPAKYGFVQLSGEDYVFAADQNPGYEAPCPAPGKEETFVFQVYGVDLALSSTNRPPGTSRAEVMKFIEGHVVARGETRLPYRRQAGK